MDRPELIQAAAVLTAALIKATPSCYRLEYDNIKCYKKEGEWNYSEIQKEYQKILDLLCKAEYGQNPES